MPPRTRKEPVVTDDEDTAQLWRVTGQDGRKVLFEGDENGARQYIESNFPRVHVEPNVHYGDEGPQADAVLVSPDGSEHVFVGGEWSDNSDNDNNE